MKVAIYIKEGAKQIILTPEDIFEKDILKMIKNSPEVHFYEGSFYKCQGGYYRQGDGDESLMILLEREGGR